MSWRSVSESIVFRGLSEVPQGFPYTDAGDALIAFDRLRFIFRKKSEEEITA